MPIHFSIGFTQYDLPARSLFCVNAEIVQSVNLNAVWASCGELENEMCVCGSSEYICVPQGDDMLIIVTVKDSDGNLFDISGAAEIVFVVSDVVGGTVYITKKKSLGDISISTNEYQFYFNVTSSETALLDRQQNYMECKLTSDQGLKSTILTGLFKSINTTIGDS